MNRTSNKYLETLEELRYMPIHFRAEDLLYESIIKSFESLGKSTCNALLLNICSIFGLSERELLTNYDLFEAALYDSLGKIAGRLLSIIKRELLTIAVSSNSCSLSVREILDPSLKIDDILKDIRTNEIIEFVKLPTHKHVAFLYTDDSTKEKILRHIIDCPRNEDGPKIILSQRSFGLSNSFNISYYKLEKNNSTSSDRIAERLSNWLDKINSLNKYKVAIKFIEADGTWWFRNNRRNELMRFEQKLCQETVSNCTSLCCFDITMFKDVKIQQIMKLITEFHEYIILDKPTLAVYKSSNRSDRPGINKICVPGVGDEI